MKNRIEHDYAPGSDLYEKHLGSALFEPYAVDLAEKIAADCTQGSVLEMACGTGILTRQLRARLKPSVSLTATDLNPGMLEYAQKKLNGAEGITWRPADITDLPFPNASFDGVVCQFGLMFAADKDRAFREMRRVLRNGGLLALSVWDRLETNSWGMIVQETVSGFFPENPPQFFKAPFNSHDVDALRGSLTAHRFDQIEIHAVSKECYSSTAKGLAIGMIQGSPLLAEIQERGGSPEPIVDAVAAIYARTGGDNPYRAPMQAIVATARASR